MNFRTEKLYCCKIVSLRAVMCQCGIGVTLCYIVNYIVFLYLYSLRKSVAQLLKEFLCFPFLAAIL